jgi:hypothetical protein
VDIDCQVSVIANDIRPYQNATAAGQGGKNDYSTRIYSLTQTLVKEGSNKVTARISCVDPSIIEVNAANTLVCFLQFKIRLLLLQVHLPLPSLTLLIIQKQ